MPMQRYGELMTWFTRTIQTDEVVFANRTISSLLPAYTPANVFYAREANLHYMSDAEVEARYLVNTYFDPPLSRERILADERAIWGTYYINRFQHNAQGNKLRRALGLSERVVERYPEKEISELIEKSGRLKNLPFRDVIALYRVDYIVWDKKADPRWRVEDHVPSAQKIVDGGDFAIYDMRFAGNAPSY